MAHRNRSKRRERRPVQRVPARPAEQPIASGADSENGAPDPLEHATPDAELAEAQLAAGRDELEPALEPADEDEFEALATSGASTMSETAAVAVPSKAAPGRRASLASRFLTFLRGVWIELQRVQWPDRRQTMQATGVVIGFVIVAGLYLGAADYLAGKLMTFILK